MILRDITIAELSELRRQGEPAIIVGSYNLAMLRLIYDSTSVSILTNCRSIDMCQGVNLRYEYYHFRDDFELKEIAPNVFLPSAERAIVDTIVWLAKNYNEGALIEALQSYQQMGKDKSGLYRVADHYEVPHSCVDYWWEEAENETDMSMG